MVFGPCATPGCYHFQFGKYCGEAHKSWGEKGCISCRKADKFGDGKFCYRCDAVTSSGAPLLVPVPEDNETYHDIANQFKKSWRHPTPCPKIRVIYKIAASKHVLDKYNAYRKKVEARGRFTSQGLTPGNQQRRWHGTHRRCYLGERGQLYPCTSAQCSLCCIIRSSLNISRAKERTGWGRFGRGIYTSSVSSKSNDYAKNLVPAYWKALLLVYVVIGKGAQYTTNQPSLTQPPEGFDSVIGKPSTTGPLNYDEQVVYTNDAVCPAYLIMYG